MIEFENISKFFQTDFWSKRFLALDNISFKISERKIIGFLGANGAGKTTSIKIMMGFSEASSGKVHYDPSLGQGRQAILSNIGYMPERPYFYPHLTGREFIHYMGQLNNLNKEKINKNSNHWSERLRIEFALDRKISTYSKGMLQRLGFLTTLIHDPKIIILDEPVSGMDPIGRKEIKDVIRELRILGKTIFFSTHIVPDVEEICDQVIFIDKGQLVFQGNVEDIIYQNINHTFIIKHKSKNQLDINEIVCQAHEKEQLIQDLLNSNKEIISVNASRATLEEIFYKVRNKERVINL